MTMEIQSRSTENVLAEVASMQKLCQQLMKTPHYAKMGEAGIFAITQKAKSIGMDPLDALNGSMYFVQGKCEMSGQAMLALIRSKGHSVSMDPKSTDAKVIMYGKRADNGDTWRVEFSTEDAKKQGIFRNQWEKMPKVMCMWRCVSQLSRFLFSDVIKGVYVQGEISDAIPFDAPVEYVVEEVVRKITQEQAEELLSILEECSPETKTKFNNFIKTAGADSIFDLPVNSYDNLRDMAVKRKNEYQEQKKVEVENEPS
jgi:hypothetical protein